MNVPMVHIIAQPMPTVPTPQAPTTVYATSQDIVITAACVWVCKI